MDTSLDSLSSPFRPLACLLLARLVERRLMVVISQTLRTVTEHQVNLARGASRVGLSKHLPRRLRGFVVDSAGSNWHRATHASDLDLCDAMDVALYEQYQLHGPDKLQWDVKDPGWLVIGEEAERIGLRWGGRWYDPVDPGHVELVLGDADLMMAERARSWPPPALIA